MTPDQQAQLGFEYIKHFGEALRRPGAAIVFDDISVRYRGATSSLKGRISFDTLTSEELSDPAAWQKKMVVQVEARLPMVLVNEICHNVAEQQLRAQASGTTPAAKDVDDLAKNFSAVVVGKSVGEGYAKLVNGELRATVAYRGGVVTANGKVLEKPAPVLTGTPPEPPVGAQ
jgi:hypothetical protein